MPLGNNEFIETNPIKSYNGYLLFMTDTINIPDSFEYHCLIINITKTEETCKNLLAPAIGFKEIMQIKCLTEKLQRGMNGLKIVRRNKRGLANFVGTACKYLYGTLDNNDQEELEEKINVIAQNSVQVNELNTIIDTFNKGIDIIKKHLEYYENKKFLNYWFLI